MGAGSPGRSLESGGWRNPLRWRAHHWPGQRGRVVTVLGSYFRADGLRDLLNPRLRPQT